MSANKYAGLPDIDTAPDVYETEDVFPSSHDNKGDSTDDENGAPARSHTRTKNGDGPSREELDMSSLMRADDASKKFRDAEKRHPRPKIMYVYPPSPSESGRTSPVASTPSLPLSQRLKRLETELASLETELADPSNPLLHKERVEGNVDPGELIRGVVNVKRRLEKISTIKEGRGKLVSAVLGEAEVSKPEEHEEEGKSNDSKPAAKAKSEDDEDEKSRPEPKTIADMDKRVGELEKIIGSSSTALDEMSPLPPPLLPLLTRLNTQLTLLTQPRHIDSITRRLKLLLSDFDRVSNANAQHHSSSQRRQTGSHHPPGSSTSSSPHVASPSTTAPTGTPSPLQEQLTPILTRLAPLLPHIPHILTRLRTLSTLHTSAAAFQSTLEGLEEEQKRGRSALEELSRAVEGVEKSLKDNDEVVRNNVKELEERVEDVGRRVEELKIARPE